MGNGIVSFVDLDVSVGGKRFNDHGTNKVLQLLQQGGHSLLRPISLLCVPLAAAVEMGRRVGCLINLKYCSNISIITMQERISLTLDPKWIRKLDKERGDISRSRFFARLLEETLNKEGKKKD
jgi:hypothetical protein